MNERIVNNDEFCPSYQSLGYYDSMAKIDRIQSSKSGLGKIIVISLNPGDDVIPVIKRICLKEKIRGAFISGMGAADRIPIAAFNLATGKYDEIVKTGYHEVSSINGNVSSILNDDNALIDLNIHLHITFADIEGNAYAGHLLTGFSSSAVGELYIQEVIGGMYRFESEILKNGFSMIRFDIAAGRDLIPECKENDEITENKKIINIITKEILKNLYPNKIVNWDNITESDNSLGGELRKASDYFNNIDADVYLGHFKKNQGLKEHIHKKSIQEIYFIIEGHAEIHIEDEILFAQKGDILYIPPEKKHWPINKSEEELKILFCLFPGEKKD